MRFESTQLSHPDRVLLFFQNGLIPQVGDGVEKALSGPSCFLGENQRGAKWPRLEVVFVVKFSEDRTEWMTAPRTRQWRKVGEAANDLTVGDWLADLGSLFEILPDFLDRRFH